MLIYWYVFVVVWRKYNESLLIGVIYIICFLRVVIEPHKGFNSKCNGQWNYFPMLTVCSLSFFFWRMRWNFASVAFDAVKLSDSFSFVSNFLGLRVLYVHYKSLHCTRPFLSSLRRLRRHCLNFIYERLRRQWERMCVRRRKKTKKRTKICCKWKFIFIK